MSDRHADRHPHGQVTTDIVGEHIAHIEVDRVEKRNALTPKIALELSAALTRLDEDPDLWVGVLSFAGEHATAGLEMPLFFSEGVDPSELGGDGVDPWGLGRRLTKPLVSAVQGICFTAGIELLLAGDIIVAADDTRFCQLEPKRGIAAIGGATVRYVQRAGWGNSMYHLLRADEFNAAEAWRIGLVQETTPAGGQVTRALELATELLECSPVALRHMIANARLSVDQGEAAALAQIDEMSRATRASEDFQEGIASFIERRPAQFSGR
ncbi:MAG: crotonase/enoyl-CoA hydratase family protein [Actinomycetota bacterium]